MSQTPIELLGSYAVGHIMEVIVVRRAITSGMAASRLNQDHYDVVVTDIKHATGSLDNAEIHNSKKLIKTTDAIAGKDDQWQVIFVDGTKLDHMLTAKGILQLVHEDPDDL